MERNETPLIAAFFGDAAVSTAPAGFEFLDVSRDAKQFKLFTLAIRATLEKKPILKTIVWHPVTADQMGMKIRGVDRCRL